MRFSGDLISASDVSSLLDSTDISAYAGSDKSLATICADFERRIIYDRVNKFDNNTEKAAASLKIHKSTLHRKLAKQTKLDSEKKLRQSLTSKEAWEPARKQVTSESFYNEVDVSCS